MDAAGIMKSLRGGLVVSCQAHAGEPLYATGMMPHMARAAVQGGARAIRCNGADIAEIRAVVNCPVIGINKRTVEHSEIMITPTLEDVSVVAASGAEIVAFDATNRPRPGGQSLGEFITSIRLNFPGLLLMADISTLEEGVMASRLGVDIVATTLSGYTPYTAGQALPNIELVEKLANRVDIPVIAEGGVAKPEEALDCLRAGAWAVTVGGAITRPHEITGRFVRAMSEKNQ